MLADRLVHQRLGERGLVALVVPEATVAEHVDDDRALELLPKLGGDFGRVHHRLGIVAVDVENRRLDHLGDIGRIGRRPRIARIGGEADLIIDDEVHGAAGAVPAQSRQTEALGDDPLSGKGRVAGNEQRHHHGPVSRSGAELVLLGAHLAQHDRVDDFEMRRIGGERQMHAVAVELAIGRGAEMVLHVARALDLVGGRGAALELVEDGAVRLAHHLRQHVEPAAVRHADDDVLHAERAAALDDLLERGDHQFGAVEAEAFGAGEFQVAELFETLGLDQLVEDRALALAREGDLLVRPLDARLDPALLRGVGDVHELDAEGLAIGAAQNGEDLTQRAEFEAEHLVDEDLAVVVGVGETVRARIEIFLVAVRLEAERVEIGVEMPARAVGADQHQGADRVARRLLHLGRGEFDSRRLRPRLDLVAERLLDLAPIRVERGNELAARARRPVRQLPGRPASALEDVGALVSQALEKRLPFGIDRRRVALVAGIKVFDVVGIAAVEERGAGEGGIGVLTGHAQGPVGWADARAFARCAAEVCAGTGPTLTIPYTIYAALALSQCTSCEPAFAVSPVPSFRQPEIADKKRPPAGGPFPRKRRVRSVAAAPPLIVQAGPGPWPQ